MEKANIRNLGWKSGETCAVRAGRLKECIIGIKGSMKGWEIDGKWAFFVQSRAVAEISYLAKSVAEKCYPGKKL